MMSGSTDSVPIDKKDLIGKKLQDRDEERLKEIAKRKQEADKVASKTESTAFFMQKLTVDVASIKEGLATAPQQPKEGFTLYFDGLSSKLADIQKFVTDSAMFLSSYDLAQKQQQLNELQQQITQCRDNLMPKKKFSFKNKKKQTTPKETSAATLSAHAEDSKLERTCGVSSDEYRISVMTNQVVDVPAASIQGKDVIIELITDCTLKIKGVPSAMHMTDLKDTTVFCGPCTRSIFVERCTNCVLVVACQQLRIHEAVDCKFFIHVTSKAIIEDSRDLQFGPYKLSYDSLEEHYKEAGLNQQINNWYDVDDFNWLVKDKQSPNWSILPADERIGHKIDF